MTVNEVFENALALLGYTNNNGISNESDLKKRELPIVNAIYSDLWHSCGKGNFIPADKHSDTIDLPNAVLTDCMIYGVAMMAAQSENDGDNQQLYQSLYNQKRARCTHTETRIDVIPNIWW